MIYLFFLLLWVGAVGVVLWLNRAKPAEQLPTAKPACPCGCTRVGKFCAKCGRDPVTHQTAAESLEEQHLHRAAMEKHLSRGSVVVNGKGQYGIVLNDYRLPLPSLGIPQNMLTMTTAQLDAVVKAAGRLNS